MESIGEFVDGLLETKRLIKLDGECETHGKSSSYAFIGKGGWYCRYCLETEQRKETEQQWLKSRTEHLHKISNIPTKYLGKKFVATTSAMKAVRGTVKAFRDLIVGERKWAVLVLMGSVGTGKTLLASELAESLINNIGKSVRYCTAKQMIAEIQSSYGMEGKSEEGEVLRFVSYDVLILDEIDAKPDRENANLLLTEVINRRYNEEKPVVVITNQPFNNLAKFVGDRVDDRLHENALVCSFDWPSFRRQQ